MTCTLTHDAAAKSFTLTDTGNGERFVQQMGDRFRYVAGAWIHFNGRFWDARNGRDRAFEAAKHVAASFAVENRSWSLRSLSKQNLDNMLACARTQLIAEPEEFDTNSLALNLQNGTLFFEKEDSGAYRARFGSHGAKDMMRTIGNANYDPDAKAPVWDRHLRQVLPDPEMRSYVQRIFGYCLTGRTIEQAFFIFHGKGGDGKTTTVSAIAEVLGTYATTLDVAKLIDARIAQNPEAPSPMLASLAGKRLVMSSEPPLQARLNESLIKVLTGGQKLKARLLKQDTFEFAPLFKMILECNSLPRIVGVDDGIWRRVRVVPWQVQIAPREMDRTLGEKLANERSGILNWLIRGALDYLTLGLSEPQRARSATKVYGASARSVATWVDQDTAIDAGAKVSAKDLWESYKHCCAANDVEPVRRAAFFSRLIAHGFYRERAKDSRSRRVMWSGRRLRASLPDCEETGVTAIHG